MERLDVILWLVEPTNYIGAGERHIIEQLKKVKTPVILVINKTDTVKKEAIFSFIDVYRRELDFQEIVPVSALKGNNTEELVRCIFDYLPYGPAFYDEDGIIIRKGGSMLKKIGSLARPEMEELLEMQVNLQLWVKVKKDWRDSDYLLKNFGYNPKGEL